MLTCDDEGSDPDLTLWPTSVLDFYNWTDCLLITICANENSCLEAMMELLEVSVGILPNWFSVATTRFSAYLEGP